MRQAVTKINLLQSVVSTRISYFYETSPVSPIPQAPYINAVCYVKSTINPIDFFTCLESIERELGKQRKPKSDPRILDIDILFYGDLYLRHQTLTLPHPRWKERLFVLVPLLDLVKSITLCEDDRKRSYDIKNMIIEHVNPHNETIKRVN